MEKLSSFVAVIAFALYTDSLRVSAAFAKALAHALFYALPADADEREKAAAQLVVERGEAIDRILNARQNAGGSKAELAAFVACWGGMYDALVAKTRLPGDRSPTASLAAKILDEIFENKITFIRLPAAAAWADGDRRYDRIVELGLEDEIASCIGGEYLPAAHRATVALGEAIGTAKARPDAPGRTALADALTLFTRAVRRYCRILAAKVEEDDAASVERFRKAVLPIDEYREGVRARGGSEEDVDLDPAVTPPTPVPVEPMPGVPNNGGPPFVVEDPDAGE